MKVCVTGGRGFIGSHLVDALIERGDEVGVLDNGVSGDNVNPDAEYLVWDLRDAPNLTGYEAIFHTAAIGRTPWAIADPILCWQTNLMASVKLLEAAKRDEVKRVVLSSSNIVYAAETPYKASKLAMEHAAKVYADLYELPTICLRYANVYGSRQREDGIGPNVFASLRKTLAEKGHVEITGDGNQSRDFIHVSDVVKANLLAAQSETTGEYDICTGINWSMNQIAGLLQAKVVHIGERRGDIRHIRQDPVPASQDLGFVASVKLEDGITDSFPALVAV